MCVKYILLVLFQLYILVNPEPTVPEEFEQVLIDFILQYHLAKSDNATDKLCETPTKYINENFIQTELYKQFQLQKYLGEDSKCENICLNLNYEIKKKDLDHVTPIIPVPTISTEPDTTSTESTSTENASTSTASTDVTTREGNIEETTTVGSGGTDEDIESKNSTDPKERTESGRQTQEKQDSGDTKTAVIVAATIMAVGTVTVAFLPVVNWVKTLLQSGTYVFPGSPDV